MNKRSLKVGIISCLLTTIGISYGYASDSETITATINIQPGLTLTLNTNTLNFAIDGLTTTQPQKVIATINTNTSYDLKVKSTEFNHADGTKLQPSIFSADINSQKTVLSDTEQVIASGVAGSNLEHNINLQPTVPVDTKPGVYTGQISFTAQVK